MMNSNMYLNIGQIPRPFTRIKSDRASKFGQYRNSTPGAGLSQFAAIAKIASAIRLPLRGEIRKSVPPPNAEPDTRSMAEREPEATPAHAAANDTANATAQATSLCSNKVRSHLLLL